MKKIVFLMLWMPLVAVAQNHQDVLSDSARAVVDRYVQMLNIDNLPQDSLLVIETAVTQYGVKDTVRMRRWYAAGEKFRVEVWHGNRIETGMVSNGKDRFHRYIRSLNSWEPVTLEDFLQHFQGYDFRGPLYNWRGKGATLSWNGTTQLKGETLQVVRVNSPTMYERYYMFEPESGLLTLIFETENLMEGAHQHNETHVEWKRIHEYQPLTTGILPSLESFMRGGVLTILSSTYHFEKLDTEIFERD